jgi:hypothetical protein
MTIVYKRKLIPIRFAISNAKSPEVWAELVKLSPSLKGHNDDLRKVGHAVRRAFTSLMQQTLGSDAYFGCVSVPDQHGALMRVWGVIEETCGLLLCPEMRTEDVLSRRVPPNADHVARFCGTWMFAESVVVIGTHDGDGSAASGKSLGAIPSDAIRSVN